MRDFLPWLDFLVSWPDFRKGLDLGGAPCSFWRMLELGIARFSLFGATCTTLLCLGAVLDIDTLGLVLLGGFCLWLALVWFAWNLHGLFYPWAARPTSQGYAFSRFVGGIGSMTCYLMLLPILLTINVDHALLLVTWADLVFAGIWVCTSAIWIEGLLEW